MPTNLSPLAAAPLPRQNAAVSGMALMFPSLVSRTNVCARSSRSMVSISMCTRCPFAIGSSWTNRSSSRRQSVGSRRQGLANRVPL